MPCVLVAEDGDSVDRAARVKMGLNLFGCSSIVDLFEAVSILANSTPFAEVRKNERCRRIYSSHPRWQGLRPSCSRPQTRRQRVRLSLLTCHPSQLAVPSTLRLQLPFPLPSLASLRVPVFLRNQKALARSVIDETERTLSSSAVSSSPSPLSSITRSSSSAIALALAISFLVRVYSVTKCFTDASLTSARSGEGSKEDGSLAPELQADYISRPTSNHERC